MGLMVKVDDGFLAEDGAPVGCAGWKALLYDQDPRQDDLPAEAIPDVQARVSFLADLADAASIDSPLERKPDLNIVLLCEGRPVFRSPVHPNVDFMKRHHVTGDYCNQVVALGEFRVCTE
jgi:hypothetical protein